MIWICAKCHYIIGTYESENSAYNQVTLNYLKQFKQFNFAQGSHFMIKWNCKNNLLSHLLPPSGFSTLHISAFSDVVLIFSYTLFHFCFALACSFTIAVPLVFYVTLGYPNHFLGQLGIQIPENAGVDIAHYKKKIGDLQLIHSSLHWFTFCKAKLWKYNL